jgi:hypothetical protein
MDRTPPSCAFERGRHVLCVHAAGRAAVERAVGRARDGQRRPSEHDEHLLPRMLATM